MSTTRQARIVAEEEVTAIDPYAHDVGDIVEVTQWKISGILEITSDTRQGERSGYMVREDWIEWL